MDFKVRARIAVEAGKVLFPELSKHNNELFAEAVKGIAKLELSELKRLSERSALVAHSSEFIASASSDFYRLQELYQENKPEMDKEYSDGKLHDSKEEYPEANIPKEDSDGKQVKDAPVWMSQVADIVRKELEKALPQKSDNYDYPEKNIPKESSLEDVNKISEADRKEALDRAETKAGEGQMGDGQVLYDPEIEKKDPYGYSKGAPQPVEGDKRVAGCDEEAPEEMINAEAEVVAEEEAIEPQEETEEPVMEEPVMEEMATEEAPAEYPEEEVEEVFSSMDEEASELEALFQSTEVMASGSHGVTASLNNGRIPSPLMVRDNSKQGKDSAESELITLFGEDF